MKLSVNVLSILQDAVHRFALIFDMSAEKEYGLKPWSISFGGFFDSAENTELELCSIFRADLLVFGSVCPVVRSSVGVIIISV